MMDNEIVEKYGPTLCAFNSYKSVGFFSREYAILRSEEMLNDVIEEYNKSDEEQKKSLSSKIKSAQLLTYRELFEKMFLCIEDLAVIVSGLMHDLDKFNIKVAKSPNVKRYLKKWQTKKYIEC